MLSPNVGAGSRVLVKVRSDLTMYNPCGKVDWSSNNAASQNFVNVCPFFFTESCVINWSSLLLCGLLVLLALFDAPGLLVAVFFVILYHSQVTWYSVSVDVLITD